MTTTHINAVFASVLATLFSLAFIAQVMPASAFYAGGVVA